MASIIGLFIGVAAAVFTAVNIVLNLQDDAREKWGKKLWERLSPFS